MGRVSSKSGRPSGTFSGPSPRPPKGQPRPVEGGRKPTPIGNIGKAVGTATPLMKAVGNIARDRKGQVKSSPNRGRTIKGSRPRPDMPSPRPPIRDPIREIEKPGFPGGTPKPPREGGGIRIGLPGPPGFYDKMPDGRQRGGDGDSTHFSFFERERGRRPPMFGGGRDRRPPMFGGGRDRPPEMSGGGRFPPGMIGNRPIVDIGRGGKPPKEGGYIIDWSNWKDPRSQEEIDAHKSMNKNWQRGDGTGFGRPTSGRERVHIQWEGPGNPSWERKNPNWRDNPRWKDHGAKYRDHQKGNEGAVIRRPIPDHKKQVEPRSDYGGWKPGMIMTHDFRDSDGDGIDDRKQPGPGVIPDWAKNRPPRPGGGKGRFWDGTLKKPVVPKYRDYGPRGNRVGVRDKSDPIGDAKRAKQHQMREALRARMGRY